MKLYKLLSDEEIFKAKKQISSLQNEYISLFDGSDLELFGACSYIHKDIMRPINESYNPKAKFMDELSKAEFIGLEMNKEVRYSNMISEDSDSIMPLNMVIYKEEGIELPNIKNDSLSSINNVENVESYYDKIKRVTNPILEKNFRWIYDKIISLIELEFKEKAVINEQADLAFPGFHIYSPYLGCENIIDSPPHVDLQWGFHIDQLESLFKEVSRETFITFTLAIEIPPNGAGLYYWDAPEEIINDYFACRKYYKNIIINAKRFLDKSKDRKEYENLLKPKFLNYKEGFITMFKGFTLHQTGLFNVGWKKEYKRITMQGHGIKCDGIWRLFF